MTTYLRIARNPEPGSKLPYLLSIPVHGGPLVLKAKETWPRTSSVYCHRSGEWSDDLEIVEEIAVVSCRRRGRAIDLVVDRVRQNRSQFVFTSKQGRELIFWQTPKTATGARPGVRIPSRRASGQEDLTIVADTRESSAAIVVEGRYSDLFDLEHVTPGFVLELVARMQVRYPSVPIVFCGTRKLAEEWTFRFLGAARAEAVGELEWGDPTEG